MRKDKSQIKKRHPLLSAFISFISLGLGQIYNGELRKELQNLKMPTLYLVGENEKIYSPQKAIQRLNGIAPQIKTELIPDAGHDLSVVQSAMVNQIVQDFLN